MKKILRAFMPLLALALFARPAGCVVHTPHPQPAVVVSAPPARVYHNGRWLYYRNNAYHYYDGRYWVVAHGVPNHVARYHRPRYVRPRPVYHRPVHRRAPKQRRVRVR